MSPELLLSASFETLYMVIASTVFAAILGIPLGFLLFLTQDQGLIQNRFVFRFFSLVVNFFRSVPFIILMIFLIPFTRFLIGTSIGTSAAIVPLSLGAAPLMARITESALFNLSNGLIEAGLAMGASPSQIVKHILWPEVLPSLINGLTLVSITLIGYSAMAGTIGGGGLGNLAINYGYQRFDLITMSATVLILIAMVQLFQWIGDRLYLLFSY